MDDTEEADKSASDAQITEITSLLVLVFSFKKSTQLSSVDRLLPKRKSLNLEAVKISKSLRNEWSFI